MRENREPLSGLTLRLTEKSDAVPLHTWLLDPEVARSFPVGDPQEIEEAAKRWVDLCEEEAALTALYQGVPVGIGILFLQHYKRLRHQAMHLLLVAKEFRCMGIGSALLEELLSHGKGQFGVELAHVEVVGDEEVVNFYRKRGFVEFARQERWIKDHDQILNRVCLEKFV